jgi:hypothetical protein
MLANRRLPNGTGGGVGGGRVSLPSTRLPFFDFFFDLAASYFLLKKGLDFPRLN